MANESKTKKEILRELFEKYNLRYDVNDPESKDNDVYRHKHYAIITRSGIQKIEKQGGWRTKIAIVNAGLDFCYVSGEIFSAAGELLYQTLASASAETSQNKYYAEMAEKRCRSRLILTVAGLYELGGVYGEDEADDFQKSEPVATKKVLYKSEG